jgi:hypothetical protein
VTTGWRRGVAVAALALLAGGRLAAQDTTGVAADSILLPSASDSTAVRPAMDSAAAVRPAQTRAARAAGPAALPEGPVVVDRVVAVVGNRPVLASQVDEEVFSRQSQGQPLPTDPDSLSAIRKQIIASIVDEELLVQQAQRDTAIKVTDQEIADGVEQQVRKVRGNFTSEVDYKNELKKAGFGTPE